MITYQSNSINGKPRRYYGAKPPWRVALIANLKNDYEPDEDDPPDAGSEFDSLKTIQAIANALESDGHWVHFLQADYTLLESLTDLRPQICFNIAEGLIGNGREAHVPSLCEIMGIPYTASRVVTSAITLDKTLTKRIWRDAGLPTAPFVEVASIADLDPFPLTFPVFVKPAREGSGMGISSNSIVTTPQQLVEQVDYILSVYRQPALLEEYLPGREFTVGFVGNPGDSTSRAHQDLYDQEGYHWFPVMEIDTGGSISPSVYGHDAKCLDICTPGAPGYLCPADISEELKLELISLTKQAARILDVCDVCRVDIRLGADQKPKLMEINTLPGLNPDLSDLCIMAAAEGLNYQTLITEILYLAAERYGLPLPTENRVNTHQINLTAFQVGEQAEIYASNLI
jgi:D-alanine-D-alanine ligase